MIRKIQRSFSLKIGLLFSSIFFILFFLLSFILYNIFSQTFIDYVTQDLVTRGNNHALALSEKFTDATIKHVALMETNVVTRVVVTDNKNNILAYSDPIDDEMKQYFRLGTRVDEAKILNRNWADFNYIVTVSPIKNGDVGYVYMYYPTNILSDTVFVLKLFIIISSMGVVLLAIGLIGILTKKITQPLIKMKEVTNEMAMGRYEQDLSLDGNDELAQLAHSIKSLGEQLQYFEDTRNEFLASVSHELRTPLTYIQGYSDVLSKGVITDRDEEKKYLQIIKDETKRVSHLVNDLFELSKLQTGKFNLNREPLVIQDLIKKVITNLAPQAGNKGLKLIYRNTVTQNVVLSIDPHRIEQVLFNLIENAIKYTDKGQIEVQMEMKEHFVYISVKDTGIGIPKEELPKIWDRFYRVEKSRTRKTGGTGLGLYVVKEIVELHGGEVEIFSSEGKGTLVRIKLIRNEVVT